MIRYDPTVEPIPTRNPAQTQILRHLGALQVDYESAVEASRGTGRYVCPPTTDQLAKHFKVAQVEMLRYLNELERDGLVRKERRKSAGITGYGYDGSLYSSVLLTSKGTALLQRHTKQSPAAR